MKGDKAPKVLLLRNSGRTSCSKALVRSTSAPGFLWTLAARTNTSPLHHYTRLSPARCWQLEVPPITQQGRSRVSSLPHTRVVKNCSPRLIRKAPTVWHRWGLPKVRHGGWRMVTQVRKAVTVFRSQSEGSSLKALPLNADEGHPRPDLDCSLRRPSVLPRRYKIGFASALISGTQKQREPQLSVQRAGDNGMGCGAGLIDLKIGIRFDSFP